MRVALVSRGAAPWHGHGGLERHVGGLKKHLELAGASVLLFTTPPRSPHREADGLRPVPYRAIPWPRAAGFSVIDRDTNYLAWSLRVGGRVLAEPGVDVVQADGGAGFGYALRSGPDAPPLVLHPHGMEEFKAPPLKRAAYLPLRSAIRYAARRAARVLAPDAAMTEEVARHLQVPAARIAVVPNAVDLTEVDGSPGASLERFSIPSGSTVLLSVGRLEENKGFVHLVRALARASLPGGWLWLLAGEGRQRGRIEREIARAGIGPRARLLGAVSEGELHALYRRADLFVHPTLYEGSSMVTLEAMAHAKPVVATHVGGIPDKIADGENGLLVPPGDDDALARALRTALASEERRASWGANARRIVEARFDWTARARELLRMYEALRGAHSR